MKFALLILICLAAVLPIHAEDDLSKKDERARRLEEMKRLENQISQEMDAYQKKPRTIFVGLRHTGGVAETYAEECVRKVEATANLNYPAEAKKNDLYGKVLIYFELLPNGEIRGTRIIRSSGHSVLDNAAKRALELLSLCPPFPQELRKRADIVGVTRTFSFEKGSSQDETQDARKP